MTLGQVFDNFIFAKQLQGCSPKTIVCYCQVIRPFIDYVGAASDLDLFTRDDYNAYIADLTSRNYSRSTLSSYVRQLKVFLRWVEDEYELNLSTSKLKVPKASRKMVHIYTDDEIRLIFDSVSAENEWLQLRNCAMVALMLDSGLRQNEVCTLRSEDISWQRGTLKVLGKGSKERVVPFGNLSRHYMFRYRALCPYSEEYFFVGRRGDEVSGDSVKHFMHKLSKKLPFAFSSHRLRHNFATNYCFDQYERFGHVDLYRLMILMGHEDIETTRIYLHHANQIIAAVSAISHLDKILKLES